MEELKLTSALLRTSCAVVLCLMFIALKFIFKEDELISQVYKYLASDIVF